MGGHELYMGDQNEYDNVTNPSINIVQGDSQTQCSYVAVKFIVGLML